MKVKRAVLLYGIAGGLLIAALKITEAVDEDRVRALGITPRELEILQHIARGMSSREIAEALFVSENTVKTHSSRLFDKLGVNRG